MKKPLYYRFIMVFSLLTTMYGVNVNAESITSNSVFMEGMRYELANRAFSLQVSERLSQRLEGEIQQQFWLDYLKLEKFNAPRYQAVAVKLGLETRPGCWTGFKAWLVGSVPTFYLETALESAYEKTAIYLDKLQELQRIGPQEQRVFLDYMLAQEVLQLKMMDLALAGRYEDVSREVNNFITQHTK